MDLSMWRPIVLFLSLLLIGTIGFHYIETISLLDSLHMTIITVFMVGFRELKDHYIISGQGRMGNIVRERIDLFEKTYIGEGP